MLTVGTYMPTSVCPKDIFLRSPPGADRHGLWMKSSACFQLKYGTSVCKVCSREKHIDLPTDDCDRGSVSGTFVTLLKSLLFRPGNGVQVGGEKQTNTQAPSFVGAAVSLVASDYSNSVSQNEDFGGYNVRLRSYNVGMVTVWEAAGGRVTPKRLARNAEEPCTALLT